MRKPGHRQGVRRYQRYGQTTLNVGRTLAPEFLIGPCVMTPEGAMPDHEAISACELCKTFCTGACDDEEES